MLSSLLPNSFFVYLYYLLFYPFQIECNLKSVVKGLQLFDYNRDGRIQRHEMRRVIENYCFKLSDSQYDK